MKNLHIILCSFFILTLSACGGGGGGGGDDFVPTDPNTAFRTSPAGSFTEGSSGTMNCKGKDTDGGKHTAVFSSLTQAQTTFLGIPAIPILGQLQLTNTVTNAMVSTIGTSYASTSAGDRRYLGYSNSTTTTVSATTSVIPETVKIGDFGNTGTYTDNVGNVDVKSWRVDDGGSGRAELVALSNVTDQFGDLQTSSTTTDLIDKGGNVISEVVVIYYATLGVTLTLNCS